MGGADRVGNINKGRQVIAAMIPHLVRQFRAFLLGPGSRRCGMSDEDGAAQFRNIKPGLYRGQPRA